ncbi:S41 family peptidase, partial [candidate division KSB1 bacterium]
QKNGDYTTLIDPYAFANQLTEDLQEISKDKHFRVSYSPEAIALLKEDEKNKDANKYEELTKQRLRNINYGFEKLKVLPGNIGYLKLDVFVDAKYGGETAIAAMQFLANTHAIIFDLRENGGGSPSMIQLITSYLYDYEPKHLNSFYWRPKDDYQQFWTLPYVPGKKMPDADVYVLTSQKTFSGAEEFTYNLKNMKRAMIVGEITGGGAHPVSRKILNDNFYMSLPTGRAINPITKTNWEGTGIEPDVKVVADEAYDRAYLLALKKLIDKETDEKQKNYYAWVIDGLEAKNSSVKMDEKIMKSYVGIYGPRIITFENGSLYYQREDRPKMKMIPIKQGLFMFDEVDYFRLMIVLENEKVVGVKGLFDNGTTDEHKKS